MQMGKQTDLQAGMRVGKQTDRQPDNTYLVVVGINGEVASQIRNHSPTRVWASVQTDEQENVHAGKQTNRQTDIQRLLLFLLLL